jgi:hypothetical protein
VTHPVQTTTAPILFLAVLGARKLSTDGPYRRGWGGGSKRSGDSVLLLQVSLRLVDVCALAPAVGERVDRVA